MHKWNNGYVVLVKYRTDSSTRVFGPFPSPLNAIRAVMDGWQLQSADVQAEMLKAHRLGRSFRPIVSKEYHIIGDPDGIKSITVETLEIVNLFRNVNGVKL